MARFSGDQHGTVIQNADVIYNTAAPHRRDHRQLGLAALSNGRYDQALAHLDEALDDDPADRSLHYYAALATLAGARPCRHLKATVDDVHARLTCAGPGPEVLVLRALLADDYTQAWRRHGTLPHSILSAVAAIAPGHRAEILRHVSAPESRVWKALTARRA